MHDRDVLISKNESLKLSATVACAARHEDIVSHIQKFISANGFAENVSISFSKTSVESFTICPSSIELQFITSDTYSRNNFLINVSFEVDHSTHLIYTSLVPHSIDYNIIRTSSDVRIKYIKFLAKIIDILPSLDELCNSQQFKSYQDDILSYIKSTDDIRKYDADKKNADIIALANSISNGTYLVVNEFKRYFISKVTKKRVYVDNFNYYRYRKTINRIDLATLIYSKGWSMAPAY